jgi:putative colanic acid biosynthesis acetyltransferase WcaF
MHNNLKSTSARATSSSKWLKIKSFLWRLINVTIFRLFPTWLKWPRIILLRIFGAKVANTARISRTATIYQPWNFEMGHLSRLDAYTCAYCDDKIKIKDKCRIGKEVNLITRNQLNGSSGLTMAPIVVGNGCWISAGSCIRSGVTLGHYTTIGAESVVIENTEPFSIVAGNPAKVIKKAIIECGDSNNSAIRFD